MFFTVLRHLTCFCVSGIFYLFNKPVYFCTICEIILSCHKVKTVSLRFLKTQHTGKKRHACLEAYSPEDIIIYVYLPVFEGIHLTVNYR